MENPVSSVALGHIRERQLLVVKEKGQTIWKIPGGKRENGESEMAALRREVKEEISVELVRILFVRIFSGTAPDGRPVVQALFTAELKGEIRPSHEIEEYAWVSKNDKDKIKDMSPITKDMFKFLVRRGSL